MTTSTPGHVHIVHIPSLRIHDLSVRQTSMALVVVDMQNLFVEEEQPLFSPAAKAIVPKVNSIAKYVRAVGGTVVWTRHTAAFLSQHASPPWFEELIGPRAAMAMASLKPGSHEHKIYDELDSKAADIFVDKFRMSAFLPSSSNLDILLKQKAIDTIIVVGTVTNFCCQSTARDAMMLDYRVIFACDATAAANDEDHNTTLADLRGMGFFDIRTTAEIVTEICQKREVA